MEGINKKYNIEIEVLTPLSIGAGAEKDWVRGVDFVVYNDKLYKLNLKKMVKAGLRPEELSSFFANKNEEGLKLKLAGKLDDVSDIIIPCPVESDNDVKAFVKNQMTGKPVLVGSSLKGAIRSVLFEYLGGTSKNGQEVFGSSTVGDEFMRFIKISDAEFDKISLVNTKIFNLQKKGAWQGGWKHGQNETSSNYEATGFNTLYESLIPGQVGVASLMIAEKAFFNFNLKAYYQKKLNELKDKIVKEYSEENQKKLQKEKASVEKLLTTVVPKEKSLKNSFLCEIINKHTKKYLEKEKAFFVKYATDRTDEIVKSIDNLLKQIPQNNSYCILKMSAGAGFHSITGDWQFEDYSINHVTLKRNGGTDKSFGVDKNGQDAKSAKSRKIAVYGNSMSLMGFVKLKPISDEEVAKRKQEVEQREQERLAEIQRQKEAKEREKREAEERQARYNSLIAEAKKLESEEKYEEAWINLQNAKNSYPECKQILVDEEFLKFKFEMIQSERQQQERQQQTEQALRQARQERAEGGLAKLLEEKYDFGPNEGNFKVTSFKVCSNKVESWLKAAGVSQLPFDQQVALFETLKRLKDTPDKKEIKSWDAFDGNIWKKVAQFVGQDQASLWFSQIITK